MATLVLGAVVTTATAGIPGIAATAAKTVTGIIGKNLDNKIFASRGRDSKGPQLSNLNIQSSTYGRMIPIVYGTVRVAGNIIWAQPLKEIATTTSSSAKGGAGKTSGSRTTYSYFATIAIAVCEGAVDEVVRVWADSEILDPNDAPTSYTLYKGAEDQMPDAVIESYEGVGSTPAYRGVSYVVIEDFPLANYGNRIPNFTFEVRKKILADDFQGESLEEKIDAVMMIPGSGEFVYDTQVQTKIPGTQAGAGWAQEGNSTRINQNNQHNKADALVSLDQLEATCPNVDWVSVVVGWFGDDMDAGTCVIKPGVEYQTGAITDPDDWAVDSFGRSTGHQITLDAGGNPVYGGTISDDSLLRYLDELNSRGFKVMFYPLFFMDVTNKPWRGRVTGSASDVATFFAKTDGYNDFIIHYANLVKDKVDAFSIGSELIGLTKVRDVSDNFPGVDALVTLAASVKAIVGSGVDVTYAADWSEYHHTDAGWYNLDPLWASSNIDFIGIDAYFPLSDAPQSGYDVQDIIDGWSEGEGYDWYYTDPERTTKANLSAAFAWKNIDWWWKNSHVNPDLATTSWVPQSKKIWFTEFGFPSVDGAANQPNVFFDPDSSESAFPYHSKGRVDFLAQRSGLMGTLKQWESSAMIERMFVWTWDARPFPFWPDLTNVWSDGGLWRYGHWINGKLGLSGLAGILSDLSARAGLQSADINVSGISDMVDGYVLDSRATVRDALADLQNAYFFDVVESDNIIWFSARGADVSQQIAEDDLVPVSSGDSHNILEVTRIQEIDLPQKIDVLYLNKISNYQVGNQHSQRITVSSQEQKTLQLPIVFSDQAAKIIADVTLFNDWLERTQYSFRLPVKYAQLEPADVIEVTVNNAIHTMRISDTRLRDAGIIEVFAVAEDISTYDFYSDPGIGASLANVLLPAGETELELLDLPSLPSVQGDAGVVHVAVSGFEQGWNGAVLYRSNDAGLSYESVATMDRAGVMGAATTALSVGVLQIFDDVNTVTISLLSGALESVSELAVLNGANAALLGDEIIQFTTATLISTNKYQLSGLLRGRLGTESAIINHTIGERFVMLDNSLAKLDIPNDLIGLERHYKPVTIGATLDATTPMTFTYSGNSLKPFSVVHVSGERDGSDNLTITWQRRTRINGDWRDNVDVPLGEDVESYEIDIMNGGNVVRTLISSATNATYTAAEQTTDFGSVQSSVIVKIYQLSAIVGRGSVNEVAL